MMLDKGELARMLAAFLCDEGIDCSAFAYYLDEGFVVIDLQSVCRGRMFVDVYDDGFELCIPHRRNPERKLYKFIDPDCFGRLAADVWQLVKNKRAITLMIVANACEQTNPAPPQKPTTRG